MVLAFLLSGTGPIDATTDSGKHRDHHPGHAAPEEGLVHKLSVARETAGHRFARSFTQTSAFAANSPLCGKSGFHWSLPPFVKFTFIRTGDLRQLGAREAREYLFHPAVELVLVHQTALDHRMRQRQKLPLRVRDIRIKCRGKLVFLRTPFQQR